jgi:hypothetical protein
MTDLEIYDLIEELTIEAKKQLNKTAEINLTKKGEGKTVHRIARALDIAHKQGEVFAFQKLMEIISNDSL